MTSSKFWNKVKTNFDLNGVSEVYFWKSGWESFDPCDTRTYISYVFLFYRLTYAIYFTVSLFLTLAWADCDHLRFWPIYLTNWSYLIQVTYALVAFFVVVGAKWEHLQPPAWGQGQAEFIGYSHKDTLPFITKLTWILFNVTNMVAVGVTAIFWLAVYNGEQGTIYETISNYIMHVFNSVLSILDAGIVATPVRFTHFVLGLSFLLVYLIFTILYEVLGGTYENGTTYIYKVLNWKLNPEGAAVTVVFALVVFLFSHIIFAWGLTKCRTYLASQLTSGYNRL